VPSHAPLFGHTGFPADPAGAGVHVPSAVAPTDFAHTSQDALQAVLQHTKSEANPLAHVVGSVAACPFFSLHTPVASHVLLPAHESGSSAFVTATHAPVVVVHVRHTPLHAPAQHTPSWQTPDTQSS
jgi:hypothetical protein